MYIQIANVRIQYQNYIHTENDEENVANCADLRNARANISTGSISTGSTFSGIRTQLINGGGINDSLTIRKLQEQIAKLTAGMFFLFFFWFFLFHTCGTILTL